MKILATIAVAFALLPLPVSAQKRTAHSPVSTKPSPPDVFLITIDTLRADHVHCYGYDAIETPALDNLAKDGIRFTQAFTPSPITNTSHTSILTGLLPSSHGVTDFGVPLASTHPTWAELLQPQRYHSAAFIGAVILDSKTLAQGLDRGFDYYDNFPPDADPASRWGRVERRGGEVVQHAEKWLSDHRRGPHFVWVHLYDPHDPYEPPAPFADKYKDRPYDGEIAYADSVLGNFVAYLKKQGWYENSLIIVVGDHGEGLGEHHENTHGIFLYDATTHVPLIVKLPRGKNSGRVVGAQVRTIDILPTVLDLNGASSAPHFDGESLRPYLRGDETSSRVAIGETDYPLRFGWAPLRSVRAEGWKYIEAPQPELYDLGTDPDELTNLSADRGAKVEHLGRLLTQPHSPDPRSDFKTKPDPKDKIEQQNLLHTALLAAEDRQFPQARAALQQVLHLEPSFPTALKQLGEVEFESGNYADSARVLKALREVEPNAASAFLEAQAREKIADHKGASDALEASLKVNPTHLAARLLLGNVYLALKNPAAAEDQFEAAQLVDGNSLEAQLGVARAQIAQSKFTDAKSVLESLARSNPSKAEIFSLLAAVYLGLGNADGANRANDRAAILDELKSKKRN